MRRTPPRMLLTLALTGIGIAMAAGPAFAHVDGDGDGHRGKTGRHAFVDTEFRPGARCFYAPAKEPVAPAADAIVPIVAKLTGVSVRPPKVAAIDRTDGVDRQRVGWRFIVQEQVGDGEWTKVRRSSLQIRRTTDKQAARFARMAVRIKADPEANYRVVTKAYWFKPRLRRIGVASHQVDYYKVRGGLAKGYCEGGLPAVEPLP